MLNPNQGKIQQGDIIFNSPHIRTWFSTVSTKTTCWCC